MAETQRHPFLHGLSKHRGAPPTVVVIFGASGDLTARKLIPAIYNLSHDNLLPADFFLVGYGRKPMSDDEFRTLAREAVGEFSRRELNPGVWERVARHTSYVAGGYDEAPAFERLARHIDAIEAGLRNVRNPSLTAAEQQRQFELVRALNEEQLRAKPGDYELEAVANSYELAWRLQNHAPDALDLTKESAATLALYGIGEEPTDDYGRQCLQARRLAESGVRYIQVNYSDNTNNPAWDQHSNLPKHKDHALRVDKPVAGLLQDLKARGLLEDTIVWWGSEFGRTPYAEKNGTGRDHNPTGFSVVLAGGGFKPGFAYGATDDFGHFAIENKVHMHDLHATILHQLGLDHEKLTFRHDGRDFRLTDVRGHVVNDLLV